MKSSLNVMNQLFDIFLHIYEAEIPKESLLKIIIPN